ncbi:MAG: protein-glutamate O-methyltransferase CheR [Prolixibacteraceae bacterium]|nr:protein-glutamate O-methyltransferase CheR [Prolixibacteraceae bacterium]MBT6765641.1 protein-glutamate O-methyltransferase CheR [Prolixibacteraceae bacterium]MBT6998825.1 protein-glutamate O-methyltransferase CheR [Prolixibacteraceae bacterium]MBT7395186.1 protein-glutamate O-methyltransferase CheR [Prolixibacteraceae bacterium]
MGKHKIYKILDLLNKKRGFDFSGYRVSLLERRIQKRISGTLSKNFDDYIEYLEKYPDELDNLFDALTINVSKFFRDPLYFNYISKIIVPDLFLTNEKENEKSLRIWSAGCSFGEEPYSMAIIINELISKSKTFIPPKIFATDIDKKALTRAAEGNYSFNSIENVKYSIFEKYFSKVGDQFILANEIKNNVLFSFYDLLDKNHTVPPDCIYGGFDIVLCRNVLIYFNPDYQKIIFDKLYGSLNKNGYLVLGEAEVLAEGFKDKFSRENKWCKIYKKVG